ncbi:MAG TPA: UDP-2,4-diacetamido-2,4,6-trideoxy-beta-L-altropyranose hydrolase [Emcibacteraceae bacterium]|nr:UDP-2,4-diacetamido-2,4,6-trideoxy-beta-L-altropyranose hydrolase [Emcibacteraceae bacterium]
MVSPHKQKPVAVFRCDASPKIGGGHVMRCLSLAGEMRKRGWECLFSSTLETTETLPQLVRDGYEVNPPETIKEADILIIDHYDLEKDYETFSRGQAKKIMVIDDFPTREHDCDILLDQTYGRSTGDYKTFVPKECTLLCGADYILLRPQFINLRKKSLENKSAIQKAEKIFVSFGATNPKGITQKVLNALAPFKDWPLSVQVIMGAQAQEKEDVKNLIQELNQNSIHNFQIEIDVEDMASYLAQADLAIGAGGSMSWERACLGVPSLVIQLADNQSDVIGELNNIGAIKLVGTLDTVQEANIDKAFESVRDNGKLLREMSATAADIYDGKGVIRVIEALDKIIGRV